MAVRTVTQIRVLTVSIAAVVVCGTTLGVVQYRSLTQLETRTRITFRDDLVRSAQAIAVGIEGDVQAAGAATLASFHSEDANGDVGDLARRFRAIQHCQPEIDELFLFALDDPSGMSAVFSTGDGADRCT